jgi:phospholipid/cholesterol/gamma-HCH transport system substrate-binding protein
VKTSGYKSTLRTHFNDAQGLRAGAPVRVAGVDVGRVSSVRVRQDLRDKPAEVTMSLQTSYELKIPSDAVVRLESDGVLGQIYPEIDITGATAPAAKNGGTLKSEERRAPSTRDLVECFAAIVKNEDCTLEKSHEPTPKAH